MPEYMAGEMWKQFIRICNTFAPDPFIVVVYDIHNDFIEFVVILNMIVFANKNKIAITIYYVYTFKT